jgi:hypothetical protein
VAEKEGIQRDINGKIPGGVTGKGFVKGDPRINRLGRPKGFDELRKLAKSIAHEPVSKQGSNEKVVINNHLVSAAEAILRTWASSPDVRKQQLFIEYAYGKVPTSNTEANVDLTTLNEHQLRRLANGDDLLSVLADKS